MDPDKVSNVGGASVGGDGASIAGSLLQGTHLSHMPAGMSIQLGTCRIFNKQLVTDIVQDAKSAKEAEDTMMKLRAQSSSPSSGRKGPLGSAGSARIVSAGGASPVGGGGPAFASSKKRDNIARKLAETRAKDQRFIKEQVDHHKEMREQRFERLLSSVTGEDMYLKGHVTEILRNQNLNEAKKISNNFREWNTKIYENLQSQLDGYLNPPDRTLIQSFQGSKNVEFRIPDEKPILRANSVDNPNYKLLYKNYQENKFRRKMDLAVAPLTYPHNGSLAKSVELDYNNKEANLRYLDMFDPNLCGYNLDDPRLPVHPIYARSKPILEPTLWGQLALQGTPYGHFAQICAHGPGFRTSRKMGNHVPPEDDGVEASGKRKTRWAKNDVGILKGEVATRGESILYKSHVGASSGAPSQDHFTYECGSRSADNEFPLGKSVLAHKH